MNAWPTTNPLSSPVFAVVVVFCFIVVGIVIVVVVC